MSTNASWQPPSWLSTARPRSRLSQLWQVPMFLLGLAALVGVCGGAVVRHGRQVQDYRERLELVRAALGKGSADPSKILALAEGLVEQASYYPDDAGTAHFLLACVLERMADQGPAEQAGALRRRALEQLELAEVLALPAEERPALYYHLGKILYLTDGDPQKAVDCLSRGLPRGADQPAEGFGLLAEALLKLPAPELDAALEANEKQINATNDETILQPARLLRAELLLRKNQADEALKVLERIGANAPKALRQKALYLQAVAYEDERMWSKAAPLWQDLLEVPELVPGGRQHIYFVLGNCYHRARPADDAKAVQAWQQAQAGGGAEGQAAAVQLAELYLHTNPPQLEAAVACLHQALDRVHAEKDLNNALISLSDVRDLVEAGINSTHEHGALDLAQQLAAMYRKLDAAGAADRKLAEISAAWAQSLEAKAGQVDGADAEALKDHARGEWLQAGEYYQAAAQAAADGRRPELLWRGVDCFERAGERERVIAAVKEYLALSVPAEEQARAWFKLGEACQAAGKKGEAENAYYKCWEFSASPFSYRARYQLAAVKMAEKDYDQAEKILWQNIKVQGSNLDRDAHEKSLYLLAGLLHQRGNYTQACLWLKEAAQQYPDNPEVFAVRDLLGDCYYRLAKEVQKKIEDQSGKLPATALGQLKKSQTDWLTKCLQTYDELGDDLRALAERQSLPPILAKLTRKAVLTAADSQFALEEYPDALRRYEAFAGQHRGQIEELIACQRIWMCCSALKFQAKEREPALKLMESTLKSALSHFAQIPDQYFQGPGTWSRQEWQTFLGQVEVSLKQSSTNVLKPAP